MEDGAWDKVKDEEYIRDMVEAHGEEEVRYGVRNLST